MVMRLSTPRLATVVLVAVVLVGLVVVVVAGLLGRLTGAPTRFTVATSSTLHDAPAQVFDTSGALRAERHGGTVCSYLDGAAGRPTYRLVVPQGYAASPNLHLLDATGRDVVGPGFATGLAFGTGPVHTPAVCGTVGQPRGVVRVAGLTG